MHVNYLSWLEKFCKTRISEIYDKPSVAIMERLDHELKVVTQTP